MDEAGGDFRKGGQHKLSPMIIRMGGGQAPVFYSAAAIGQNIQINGPRAPFDAPCPAQTDFDFLERFEEFGWPETCFYLDDAVKKIRLRRSSNGIRVIQRGYLFDGQAWVRGHVLESVEQHFFGIPFVGTQRDEANMLFYVCHGRFVSVRIALLYFFLRHHVSRR